MLDPQLKARWYAAMRSGQYKFGKGTLRDPKTGCYCALGVLADITGFEISKDGFDLFVNLEQLGINPFNIFTTNDRDDVHNFENFITKYEDRYGS